MGGRGFCGHRGHYTAFGDAPHTTGSAVVQTQFLWDLEFTGKVVKNVPTPSIMLPICRQKKLPTLLLRDGLINVTSSRVSKILLGPLSIRIWLMRRLASSTMTNRRLDSLSTEREHWRWCSRGYCTWHSKSEPKRRPWWWVLHRRWWWSRTDPPLVWKTMHFFSVSKLNFNYAFIVQGRFGVYLCVPLTSWADDPGLKPAGGVSSGSKSMRKVNITTQEMHQTALHVNPVNYYNELLKKWKKINISSLLLCTCKMALAPMKVRLCPGWRSLPERIQNHWFWSGGWNPAEWMSLLFLFCCFCFQTGAMLKSHFIIWIDVENVCPKSRFLAPKQVNLMFGTLSASPLWSYSTWTARFRVCLARFPPDIHFPDRRRWCTAWAMKKIEL